MTLPVHHRAAAAMLAVAALGVAACSAGTPSASSDPPTAALPPPATMPAPPVDTAPAAAPDQSVPTTDPLPAPIVSPPRQVVIPSIEVDASIIDLGLSSDGTLETPTDFDLAGWWAGGTVADADGPTVIVGHVDDQDGPAVFFRLQELEPGDEITVLDALGREQTFTVVDKGLYDKNEFPTDRVYGASDSPTLRLVTCGGDFDHSARSYESNWVVYAER